MLKEKEKADIPVQCCVWEGSRDQWRSKKLKEFVSSVCCLHKERSICLCIEEEGTGRRNVHRGMEKEEEERVRITRRKRRGK